MQELDGTGGLKLVSVKKTAELLLGGKGCRAHDICRLQQSAAAMNCR